MKQDKKIKEISEKHFSDYTNEQFKQELLYFVKHKEREEFLIRKTCIKAAACVLVCIMCISLCFYQSWQKKSEKKYNMLTCMTEDVSLDVINNSLQYINYSNIADSNYVPYKLYDGETGELMYYKHAFDIYKLLENVDPNVKERSTEWIITFSLQFHVNKDYPFSFYYNYQDYRQEIGDIVFEYSEFYELLDDDCIANKIYAKITTPFEEIYIEFEGGYIHQDESFLKQLFINYMTQMFSLR